MTIKFRDFEIKGTHGPIHKGPVDVRTRRFSIFGAEGTAEVYGKRGDRDLTFDIVIHNDFDTANALIAYLKELESKTGEHGVLKETGTIVQTFHNCTFESLMPRSFSGQESPGPILDLAGLMTSSATPQANKWIAAYHLRFKQLKVG